MTILKIKLIFASTRTHSFVCYILKINLKVIIFVYTVRKANTNVDMSVIMYVIMSVIIDNQLNK